MAETSGLPARRAALRMLDAALRRGETLEGAARAAARGLRAADAGLARAIATESLRWMTDLDALIDSATRKSLPADAKARSVLRLMLAQALRLDTPAHAVIATGLPLLTGGPRRLAHGVFSTLMKQNAALPDAPTLPEAVAARWAWRDDGELAALRSGLSGPPPLDITLRNASDSVQWAERLAAQVIAPGLLRLPRGHAVEDLPGYGEGAWWVQDLAAALPALLLGNGDGRNALDLCAAPGGKTMQLAASGWQVTALDNAGRRLDRLRTNLARTGLAADAVRADVMAWQTDARFDAVLLDAPCSATGTCRRHPEVLHRVGQGHIAEFAATQAAMIARAAQWLAPGGRLVYAVCSLEREEGVAIAQGVEGMSLDPIDAGELPSGLKPDPAGWLATHPGLLPDLGGLDGFFVARFRKD